MAKGRSTDPGVSSAAIKLMEGVLQTMLISKVKVLTAFVVAVAVIGIGTGILRYRVVAAQERPAASKSENGEPIEKTRQAGATTIAPERPDNVIDVPSPHEGILAFVGTPAKSNNTGAAGGLGAKVKKLRVGDKVEKGQVLAGLDTRLLQDDVRIAQAKLAAAQADQMASEKTRDEAYKRYETQQMLQQQGRALTSMEEVRGAKLAYERYVYEVFSKKAAIRVAEAELKHAETVLDSYIIHSPVKGVIKKVYKRAGEGVKYLDPIVQIEISEESP
jgi:biotin carboxyl carrier protein